MKQDQNLQPSIPLCIDATISTDMTRVAKVNHQGVEETVRIMNRVLRKMSAGIQLEIVKSDKTDTVEDVVPDQKNQFEIMDSVSEEPLVGTRA